MPAGVASRPCRSDGRVVRAPSASRVAYRGAALGFKSAGPTKSDSIAPWRDLPEFHVRSTPYASEGPAPMRNSGKAPTMAVWIISLVLFLIAVAAQFRFVDIGEPVRSWSWIIGFALLLIACRVRGL